MSLKLWLVLFTMREVTKFVEEKKETDPQDAALAYAKWLLAWESGAKVRKNLEALLRGAVNAFPYRHSLLFETLMKVFSISFFIFYFRLFQKFRSILGHQRTISSSKPFLECGKRTYRPSPSFTRGA